MQKLSREIKEKNVRWVSKMGSKLLKLVMSFSSKDVTREILHNLLIDKGSMFSSDGTRFIKIETPNEFNDLEDGRYILSKFNSGEGYVQVSDYNVKDTSNITKKIYEMMEDCSNQEPIAKFLINPKLIKDLTTFAEIRSSMEFSFFGDGKIIRVRGNVKDGLTGYPYEAYIMPMFAPEDHK